MDKRPSCGSNGLTGRKRHQRSAIAETLRGSTYPIEGIAMHPIVAGTLATAAMSGFMRTAQGAGLLRRPPPGMITERAIGSGGSEERPARPFVNTVAHFAYGASLAWPFAALRRRMSHRTRIPVAGFAYGLAVYAFNYEALLPTLRLMPPAHRDSRRRIAAMIGAHLVYGAVLDWLVTPRRQ
jgi:hypothetical protein